MLGGSCNAPDGAPYLADTLEDVCSVCLGEPLALVVSESMAEELRL